MSSITSNPSSITINETSTITVTYDVSPLVSPSSTNTTVNGGTITNFSLDPAGTTFTTTFTPEIGSAGTEGTIAIDFGYLLTEIYQTTEKIYSEGRLSCVSQPRGSSNSYPNFIGVAGLSTDQASTVSYDRLAIFKISDVNSEIVSDETAPLPLNEKFVFFALAYVWI